MSVDSKRKIPCILSHHPNPFIPLSSEKGIPLAIYFSQYDEYLSYLKIIVEKETSAALSRPYNGTTLLITAYTYDAINNFEFLISSGKINPFKTVCNANIFLEIAKSKNSKRYMKSVLSYKGPERDQDLLKLADEAIEIATKNNFKKKIEMIQDAVKKVRNQK